MKNVLLAIAVAAAFGLAGCDDGKRKAAEQKAAAEQAAAETAARKKAAAEKAETIKVINEKAPAVKAAKDLYQNAPPRNKMDPPSVLKRLLIKSCMIFRGKRVKIDSADISHGDTLTQYRKRLELKEVLKIDCPE